MKIFLTIILLFFIGFNASCTEIDKKPFIAPDITFENYKPIVIAVNKIEIFNDYKSPMKAPNVEYLFYNMPDFAAEQLIKRRLVALGGKNILKVIIGEASVIKEDLPVNKVFLDYFKVEPVENLKAKLILHFELINKKQPNIILGKSEIVVTRDKTLMEGMSLSDRDKAYFQLTEDLMYDLNKAMQKIIRKAFGDKDF